MELLVHKKLDQANSSCSPKCLWDKDLTTKLSEIRQAHESDQSVKQIKSFFTNDNNEKSIDVACMNYTDDTVNDPSLSGDSITKRNLIVNYLPQTFTDVELFGIFAPFGAIDSVRIMKDSKTGYSFGFGFVNFIDEEEAITAQGEMNGFQVESKKIKVSFARPPSDDIKDTNLYITNLPRDMSEDELVDIFKPYGSIIQKKVLRDKYTNLPRGVAFIRYERREQASIAITTLNNSMPSGCTEPIRIRLAEDHGKQKAAYLQGFQAGMVVPRQQDSMGKWRINKSRSRSNSSNFYSRR